MAVDINHLNPQNRRKYALTFLQEAQLAFDESANGAPSPERAAAAAAIASAHFTLAQLDIAIPPEA